MTISLPPLPEPDAAIVARFGPPTYTAKQVQQFQREAMQAALEAAAKVCDQWTTANHVYVNGATRCAADIRALEIHA